MNFLLGWLPGKCYVSFKEGASSSQVRIAVSKVQPQKSPNLSSEVPSAEVTWVIMGASRMGTQHLWHRFKGSSLFRGRSIRSFSKLHYRRVVHFQGYTATERCIYVNIYIDMYTHKSYIQDLNSKSNPSYQSFTVVIDSNWVLKPRPG